jgi:geranylgeranyl diphosphate synthase type I
VGAASLVGDLAVVEVAAGKAGLEIPQMLEQRLAVHKRAISDYLTTFLAEQRQGLVGLNRWGSDVMNRQEAFAGQGKMLRGCLVVIAAEMFGRQADSQVLATAAAIEIMHASLLVHDDIMDNDRLRRGQPTILAQYEDLGMAEKAVDHQAYGRALATCFGDLGFFMAWELIGRSGEVSAVLTPLFSREMALVCLAQMEDVAAGMTPVELQAEQIEEIYRCKTARYTFSLPLMCGAALAGQSGETLDQLAALGEYLGLMFQMKDDELGLFGDSQQTGKPVGSDISENKKTLLRLWLLERCSESQRQALQPLFGAAQLSQADIDTIRGLAEQLGVRQAIDSTMSTWAEAARRLIDQLPVEQVDRDWLGQLADYNRQRIK